VFNHIFQFADSTIEHPGHLRSKLKLKHWQIFALCQPTFSSSKQDCLASFYEHQTEQDFSDIFQLLQNLSDQTAEHS